MRTDQVEALARAAFAGDRAEVRRCLGQISANLKAAKKHHVAARFDRLVQTAPRSMTTLPQDLRGIVHEFTECARLDDLTLCASVRRQVDQFLAEHRMGEAIHAAGLEPSRRLMLAGPPGNGKTSLAGAIAAALARPLMVVSYAGLIDSHLGATGSRLQKVFDGVGVVPCVLLIDEFDAIGASRRSSGEAAAGAEMRRVTNSLLMGLETLDPNIIFIAATNLPNIIDEAMWRRFDVMLRLDPPTPELLLGWAQKACAKLLVGGAPDAPAFVEALTACVPSPSFAIARAALAATVKSVLTGLAPDWRDALTEWAAHRDATIIS